MSDPLASWLIPLIAALAFAIIVVLLDSGRERRRARQLRDEHYQHIDSYASAPAADIVQYSDDDDWHPAA